MKIEHEYQIPPLEDYNLQNRNPLVVCLTIWTHVILNGWDTLIMFSKAQDTAGLSTPN